EAARAPSPAMGRRAGLAVFSLALVALALAAAPSAADTPERPGVALRAALAARSAGDLGAAATQLDAVETRWPVVGGHAARLALETRSAAAKPEDVLAGSERFVARYPSSPLRPRVARLRGDAAHLLGRDEIARRAWREALASEPDASARSALLLAIATS